MKGNITLKRTCSWIDTTNARLSSFHDPGPQRFEGFVPGLCEAVEVLLLPVHSVEDKEIHLKKRNEPQLENCILNIQLGKLCKPEKVDAGESTPKFM